MSYNIPPHIGGFNPGIWARERQYAIFENIRLFAMPFFVIFIDSRTGKNDYKNRHGEKKPC
jgi:hypothetical protein